MAHSIEPIRPMHWPLCLLAHRVHSAVGQCIPGKRSTMTTSRLLSLVALLMVLRGSQTHRVTVGQVASYATGEGVLHGPQPTGEGFHNGRSCFAQSSRYSPL